MKIIRLHPGKGRITLYLGMPGWIAQMAIAVVYAHGAVGRSLEFDLWAPKWARNKWFRYAYASIGVRYSGKLWARIGGF